MLETAGHQILEKLMRGNKALKLKLGRVWLLIIIYTFFLMGKPVDKPTLNPRADCLGLLEGKDH